MFENIIYNDSQTLVSLNTNINADTRYKLSFHIDNMFHFKIVVKNNVKSYNLTQNLYSDAGTYKIALLSPISGDLYIYKSPDRKNSWERMENVTVSKIG